MKENEGGSGSVQAEAVTTVGCGGDPSGLCDCEAGCAKCAGVSIDPGSDGVALFPHSVKTGRATVNGKVIRYEAVSDLSWEDYLASRKDGDI